MVVRPMIEPMAAEPAPRPGSDARDTGCVVGKNVPETGSGTPPVIPCTGEPDVGGVPAAVTAVLVLIEARLPPVSSASADVLRFVPALAVTEPPVVCIGEPSV